MATNTRNTRPEGRQTAALADEISEQNRPDSPVVRDLRREVGNAFVLYANYKHYHWQTYGPLFRDLHKLFDRMAADALASIDPLAERMRMIGQDPPSRLPELADIASVAAAAPHSTMREMIEEADKNLLIVIKDMREAVKRADEHDDPGTADVFTRLVQDHEKYEWWLRDILKTGDGLCN